jgi:hypothetical protein
MEKTTESCRRRGEPLSEAQLERMGACFVVRLA